MEEVALQACTNGISWAEALVYCTMLIVIGFGLYIVFKYT